MNMHEWLRAHPYRPLGWIMVGLLAVYLLLAAALVRADTVTVTWAAPTERVDGTPLTAAEIAGYRLEWSVRGATQAPITLGAVTSYALDTGALSGRTCVTLRTIDTDGLESDATSPACKNARPRPPANVKAER